MNQNLEESVRSIRARISDIPDVAVILGSGLGGLGDAIEEAKYIDYADIPHFHASTAPSHKGRLIFGRLGTRRVVCMQGRVHCYEGLSASEAAYPVQVLAMLGVKKLIITNAAGGINTTFDVGDFMLIDDHINFTGRNPLIGPNDEALGPRFCDMTHAYSPELAQKALEAAEELSLILRRGVYIGVLGPNYETPAEIRAFRILGADAVGMSTVPEVIAAAHCGVEVLAISIITNMAAGVLDKPLTLEEVIEIGDKRSGVLQRLVSAVIDKL